MTRYTSPNPALALAADKWWGLAPEREEIDGSPIAQEYRAGLNLYAKTDDGRLFIYRDLSFSDSTTGHATAQCGEWEEL